MPENMFESFSEQEFYDLLALLLTKRAAAASPEQPIPKPQNLFPRAPQAGRGE
jgi:hypothetical protein